MNLLDDGITSPGSAKNCGLRPIDAPRGKGRRWAWLSTTFAGLFLRVSP